MPEALEKVKPIKLDWWSIACLRGESGLALRFEDEARSALPTVKLDKETGSEENLENFFQGVMFQQMVLKRDQQLTEWHTANIFSGQLYKPNSIAVGERLADLRQRI